MNMETADGRTFLNVDAAKLKEVLSSLDKGNDFAILSNGENYLQCAYSANSYCMEYQDSSGHYESLSGNSSYEETEKIFLQYLENGGEITIRSEWRRVSAEQSQGENFHSSGNSSGSLVDQLKSEAKRGLKRAINRKTSGLVRNALNKLIK